MLGKRCGIAIHGGSDMSFEEYKQREYDKLADAIRELCGEIGIPANLTEAINNASKTGPVSAEEIENKIEAMAVDAMKSGNIAVNPRSSRQCDIEMLYRKAL